MKTTLAPRIVPALLALVLASTASAAVIVDYAMTANGAALNSALYLGPTDTASHATATALANQDGNGTTGSFNYEGGTNRVSSWAITYDSTDTTFAGAVAAGNYITFSITPDAGYQFDLSSITFEVASGSSSTTSNRAFYLVTADDPSGFTGASTVLSTDRTPGGGGSIPVQAGTGGIDTVPQGYTADLSSLAGITTTQYFRIYLQAGIAQSLTFDNITVNGAVSAIPEPAACAAFAGAVLLGLAALMRRRRRIG